MPKNNMNSEPVQKPRRKWRVLFIVSGIFLAGIVFAGMTNVVLSSTNEMSFCISCHSMGPIWEEYQETVHFKNASGVQTTCADCHVPQAFVPKVIAKIKATKELYHEFVGTIDTKEKLEQHRWTMASRVWAQMKANGSRECLSCHAFTHMDLSEQDRSARRKHGSAPDGEKTCIDCHKGIAHEEPEEPEDLEDPEEG